MAPPQRQQMSAADLELLSEILRRAEAVSEQQRPSLLNILRQYEDVLREHGIGSTNDTYFYKIILQLSRMPGNDWWAKLAAESQVSSIAILLLRTFISQWSAEGLGCTEQERRRAARCCCSAAARLQADAVAVAAHPASRERACQPSHWTLVRTLPTTPCCYCGRRPVEW